MRLATRRSRLHPSLFNAGRVGNPTRAAAAHTTRSIARTAAHSNVRETTPTPTLYVNAGTGVNTGSCRLETHPCLTIDYAISVAPAAAVIDVATGTYAEQVVDSAQQKLTIVGNGVGNTIIDPTSLSTTDPDPTIRSIPVYAIVDAQPGSKVKLEDLTINGAGATNQFTCGNNFVGVYYHDAKGKMTNVDVENIELPEADFGCQGGLAIYATSDASKTTKVTMNSVTVTNYDKNGITCDDAGTTCKINNSTVTGLGSTGLIA